MKLIWLALSVFLAAGITCTDRSGFRAEPESMTVTSSIEVIVDSYTGGAAATALLAAGLSEVCGTSVVNDTRSMWGQ